MATTKRIRDCSPTYLTLRRSATPLRITQTGKYNLSTIRNKYRKPTSMVSVSASLRAPVHRCAIHTRNDSPDVGNRQQFNMELKWVLEALPQILISRRGTFSNSKRISIWPTSGAPRTLDQTFSMTFMSIYTRSYLVSSTDGVDGKSGNIRAFRMRPFFVLIHFEE